MGMKMTRFFCCRGLLTAACLMMVAVTARGVEVRSVEADGVEAGGGNRQFALGADISGATAMEAHGDTVYSPSTGEPIELTALMKELGLNAVRLRVWVNPRGNFSGPWDVLEMARRAKALGMDVMIDFHYSDWWADPGKQNIPAAWEGMTYEQMKGALAAHTFETLQLLKENGIDVKWVQIGNETTGGMLWPMGKTDENMEQYAGLTRAGYEAAKRVYPEAQVIVHLDDGYNLGLYEYIFDELKRYDCPWDVIGMSVYPFWSKRDQSSAAAVDDIVANIDSLNSRYGCDVMVVETGVECSDPEGGREFLSRLIDRLMATSACTGVFYWAPEADAEGPYKLGAFSKGRPTVIMEAFSRAARMIHEK